MTQVVDEITVKITLYHCKDELKVWPLRRALADYWNTIACYASEPCTEGTFHLEDGKIEVDWQNTGLHEIPEETGSDN